eukprot:gene31335-66145_t
MLGIALATKVLGLDPAKAMDPMQTPFKVQYGVAEGKKYTGFHVFRMSLGSIGGLGSVVAGILMGFQGHAQMTHERVNLRHKLWDGKALLLCFIGQTAQIGLPGLVIFQDSLLCCYILVCMMLRASAAMPFVLGAGVHVACVVLTNIFRLAFFAKAGFNCDKMSEIYVWPTCPCNEGKGGSYGAL